MRCGRCGNENDATNRFCGMCGAALVAEGQGGGQGVSASQVSASQARPRMEPVITGPSFLGLNTPVAGTGRAGVNDRDPLRPSSSVDYLLDDEEEPRRSWGKWILVIVALALVVGFGYLRWKQGGFELLNGGDKKPAAATTQTPEAGQSGADSGAVAGTSANAGGAAPRAGAGAASVPAASPAEAGATQSTSSQTSSEGTPSQGAPAPSTPSSNTPAPATASQSTDQPISSQSDAGDSGAPASGSQAASSDSEKSAAVTTPRAVAHKPAAAKPAAAKSVAAKPAAAKSVDSVTEAERYIYGRGEAQDCDRGLRMLKPAAEQSNVKAMVSLGALYSTGTCTPRDLPTAYRWFALALHKEPDNQALQNDLQNLWSKMTPPERQLAIKLSQ